MAEEPFPTNAATATIMWLLLAVGVVLGMAVDNKGVMFVFALIGIAIHWTGLVREAE